MKNNSKIFDYIAKNKLSLLKYKTIKDNKYGHTVVIGMRPDFSKIKISDVKKDSSDA